MAVAEKFTSADILSLPDDNKRFEIIERELYVSRAPGYEHQYACTRLIYSLEDWNSESEGGVVLVAPGLIFADDDDVVPDIVWISRDLMSKSVDEAGYLR